MPCLLLPCSCLAFSLALLNTRKSQSINQWARYQSVASVSQSVCRKQSDTPANPSHLVNPRATAFSHTVSRTLTEYQVPGVDVSGFAHWLGAGGERPLQRGGSTAASGGTARGNCRAAHERGRPVSTIRLLILRPVCMMVCCAAVEI